MIELNKLIQSVLQNAYEQDHMCVAIGDKPNVMYDGDIDDEGWTKWKFVESHLSNDNIKILEDKLKIKIPIEVQEYFLIPFHHMVDQINNGDYLLWLVSCPCDAPFSDFENLVEAWSELPKFGYVPFAQYQDGWGPICFKVEDQSIVWFDHEVMPFEPKDYNLEVLKSKEQKLHKNIYEFWTQQLK